jgi:hypothetical protein
MNSDSKWQNVLRVVWMSGGLVAINKAGPKVQISAGLNGPNVCTFGIDEYAALFHILRVRGFLIVVTTFVLDAGELQGFARPDFRVMSQSEGWLIWDEIQKWRQIAFAAGKSAQMSLMDIASRIACGLRYSQMRVADLAAAYSAQLRAYLHAHRADEYVAFKDTYSFDVYKSIHALFWEMAVLRDTLAEFAAAFCFSQSSLRTMRGLRKWLQANHRDDSLAPEILRITDSSRNGWLATFSNYRNCFTHSAPLEQVAGIAFAVQDMKTLSDGSRTTNLLCPSAGRRSGRAESLAWYFSCIYRRVNRCIKPSKRTRFRTGRPGVPTYMHQ